MEEIELKTYRGFEIIVEQDEWFGSEDLEMYNDPDWIFTSVIIEIIGLQRTR